MIYRAVDVMLWPQFNFLLRVCILATTTHHPDSGGRTLPGDEEVYKKVKTNVKSSYSADTFRSSVWRGKQNAVSQRDEELARTAGLDAPHPPRKLNQQKKNPPKKTHVFYSCFFFLNKETHSIPHFAPEHRLLFMRLATETKTTWEH